MKLFNMLFVEVSIKLQIKSLQLPPLYFTITNLHRCQVLLLPSQSNVFGCSQGPARQVSLNSAVKSSFLVVWLLMFFVGFGFFS